MKTSIVKKTIAALAIGASFSLAAIAAPAAKTNPSGVRARRAITTRKEFALKHGLSKRTASEGVGAADAHETVENFPQQPIIAPLDLTLRGSENATSLIATRNASRIRFGYSSGLERQPE